jgi:hypothetical protein
VVHAFKTLRQYLLDKPFELHTDNASLQWLQQQRHLSHHQARWLNLLAEFQYRVVHIPGRTNPANFLTRKHFPDGVGPARHTGYLEPDPGLELFTTHDSAPATVFVTAGPGPESDSPLYLRTDFVVALQTALPSDLILGTLAAAAAATPASAHVSSRLSFVLRDGLLYRRSPRGDRLCTPAGGGLRLQVLSELHATPLGGHFGRDKTLSLARRSVWWQGLPADVEAYVLSCPTCQRVKADHLHPPGLLFPLPAPTSRGGCISLEFLELLPACSGHDFLQVHFDSDLLTGRVWPVPTFKTATSATAARNFVSSVFRDGAAGRVGPRHALHQRLLDRPARRAGRLARLACLRLPSPPQHHEQGRARQRRDC